MAARRRKASLDNFREGVLGSDRVSMPARGYLDALSSDRSGPEQEGVRIPITRRWALSTDLSSQRMLSPAASQLETSRRCNRLWRGARRGTVEFLASIPAAIDRVTTKTTRSMPFRSDAPLVEPSRLVRLDDPPDAETRGIALQLQGRD